MWPFNQTYQLTFQYLFFEKVGLVLEYSVLIDDFLPGNSLMNQELVPEVKRVFFAKVYGAPAGKSQVLHAILFSKNPSLVGGK